MAVIRINISPSGLSLHNSPRPVPAYLREVASRPGPIVILVHGYKYYPGRPEFCPHRKIFGDQPEAWPSQLGFVDNPDAQGLCIALGWQARGPLKAMYQRAQRLGKSVAELVALLHRQNPGRSTHFVAHSLGSEACLCALPHLAAGAVSRIILLTGASYARRTQRLLDTPAGRHADVLNITSRENDVFDAAFERIVPSDVAGDMTIGQGIGASNVVTLQLDCRDTLDGLERLGFPIALSNRRICHWSAYTRPGVMAFYARFLRVPDCLPLALIGKIAPSVQDPRWSRLFAGPMLKAVLSRRAYTALLHRRPNAAEDPAPSHAVKMVAGHP